MTKPGCTFLIMLFLIALSVLPSFSKESGNLTKPQDRFGTYPAYRFNPYYNPFYDYQPPYAPPGYASPPSDYAAPYYYDPYWRFAYSWLHSDFKMSYPWWLGEHGGLQKTLDIARARSSMRIFWGGSWQPP